MESILLVSGSRKGTESFTELLKSASFHQITAVNSGGEARRLLSVQDFDLVIVNTPLTDETGYDMAVQSAERTVSGVVLFVKNETVDEVSAKVEEYGVFVVGKPVNRQLAFQFLKLAMAARRRMMSLERANINLQNKIEEIRLVDRAKCLLIQYEGLDEAGAHRCIEKRAMDDRIKRKEVALEILARYEKE